ncbi:MAG TPA: hypothetical protein VJT50_11345 [Pyrinomonadaceae bacterium]|nr:hypothetical protein [Pyrinomonadaceae bacterium]
MNDRNTRRHQMFVRVRDFGNTHESSFPPTSLTSQVFTQLANVVEQLDTYAAHQVSSSGVVKRGTLTRAEARRALRLDLEVISKTAQIIGIEVPGIQTQFLLPQQENDEALLNTARSFAENAVPLSGSFVTHELPENFLDVLNEDIEEFAEAVARQATGRGQRSAALAGIDETIEEGMTIVKKLDRLIKNKFAENPTALAEWITVSHLERDPRRSPSPPPSTGAGTNPPPTP